MPQPQPTGAEWVSTATLSRWADEPGVRMLGPAVDDLAPGGRHTLTALLPPAGGMAGMDFAAVRRDGRRATLTVSFPRGRFMKLLQDSHTHLRETELYGLDSAPAAHWAGTRSLDIVRDRIETMAQGMVRARFGHLAGVPAALQPQLASANGLKVALLAAHGLHEAVPIVVDPTTLAGLPNFTDLREAFRFGEMITLPFPATYLDTTGEDGRGAQVEVTLGPERVVTIELFGAVVTSSEDGGVAVLPFGRSVAGDLTGTVPELFGRMVFGVPAPRVVGFDAVDVPVPGWEEPARMAVIPPMGMLLLRAATGEQGDISTDDMIVGLLGGGNLSGRIELGGTIDELELLGPAAITEDGNALPEVARVLTALACDLLGVFFYLDAPDAKLEPVGLPRPARRRAEREGAKVANTVVLHPAPGRATRDPDEGPRTGRHSYRYLVRGTWAHYPRGTQMADARPDLVRPCPRERCQGACRRVLHPPHWRGPAEGPVIVKTRVLPLVTGPRAGDEDTDTAADG